MATSRTRSVLAAAAAGVAAVLAGVGIGEFGAAVLVPASSPVAAVGGALIDAAPPWAKDLAIELFGTADKLALLAGIALALGLIAAGAGLLESRRRPWGAVVVAGTGAVGAVVAMSRAGASALSWLPALLAGAVAAVALRFLTRLAARAAPTADDAGEDRDAASPAMADIARRRFLVWSGVAAAAGVVGIAVGGLARAGTRAATAVRDALKLPAPAAPAPAIPAAAELGIPELASVVTSNDTFYRIDTALVVPHIEPADWRLRIFGLVEREVTLTWDELLALPLQESDTTLTCVSNPVGGGLIGNARWLGYPVRELLARAQPTEDADMVLSRSIDGFTASTPLEVLTDDRDAILAVGMNGVPLPAEHGFPVRMVVPGLYGYVSATKWVVELEVTRFDRAEAYWTSRGWSAHGPVKLHSRIDVPRSGRSVPAGAGVIAGMAWQQHVGVSGVEVQIDDDPWRPASLATAISADTWVQWSLPWTATEGAHRIRCRAIGADGDTQTGDITPPAPDGATGWHTIEVEVIAA